MKTIVLMLLLFKLPSVTVAKLNIHQFDEFEIEFNTSCSSYLWMYKNEPKEDVYLSQTNDTISLLILVDQSYEMYESIISDNLIFNWPFKTINSKKMLKIESKGNLSKTFNFDSSEVLCPISGFSGAFGSMAHKVPEVYATECEIYKCPEAKEWKLYVPIIAALILFAFVHAILLINGSEETLLRQKISRLIQWTRKILSRSEESLSKSQEENYTPVFTSRV